jgi:hypothetical protein
MVAHTVKAAKAALAAKAKPRKGSYTVIKPTGAALSLVKPYLIDKAVRWAQTQDDICELFESALRATLGAPPARGWRDSDGYDCRGLDVDGYDRNDEDERGFNRNGLSRWGHPSPFASVENLVRAWDPMFKTQVRRELERSTVEAARLNRVGWPAHRAGQD